MTSESGRCGRKRDPDLNFCALRNFQSNSSIRTHTAQSDAQPCRDIDHLEAQDPLSAPETRSMAWETMPLSQQVRPPRDHGERYRVKKNHGLSPTRSLTSPPVPVRSLSQEEVAICMTAIRELLAQPDLAAMFGAPVDVKALDGYLTVVERPMDLKTICDAESSYHSYKFVLKDVRLVWQNCTAYWGQASKKDDPTGVLLLDMCEKARGFFKAAFDRACRARGVRLLDPALAGVVHAQQQFVGSVQRGGSNHDDDGGSDGGPSTSPRELKIVDLDMFTVYAVSPDSESDDGEHTDREPFDLVGLAQQRVSRGEMSVRISGTLQAARKKSTISLSLVKDAAKNEPPKTVEGEEVLAKIRAVPTGSRNGHQDVPTDPVIIESVEVAEA